MMKGRGMRAYAFDSSDSDYWTKNSAKVEQPYKSKLFSSASSKSFGKSPKSAHKKSPDRPPMSTFVKETKSSYSVQGNH